MSYNKNYTALTATSCQNTKEIPLLSKYIISMSRNAMFPCWWLPARLTHMEVIQPAETCTDICVHEAYAVSKHE